MKGTGMILDCHLHLWDPDVLDYPWLADLPELNTRFDLARLGAHRQVGGALMMEADCRHEQAREEIAWVKSIAAAGGEVPVLGMIAFAPIESATVGDWIDDYAADPFVVGVRRLFHDEGAGFMERDEVIAGARRFASAGLPFDATVRQHQLAELARFARSVPELTIVVDHFGKPTVSDPDSIDAWRRAWAELAACPQVVAKLSGIGAEADRSAPLARQARPYLEATLELFGPRRCLIGSDWPVSTAFDDPGWGYDDWMTLVGEALQGASEDERWAVGEGTARRVYGVQAGGNDG